MQVILFFFYAVIIFHSVEAADNTRQHDAAAAPVDMGLRLGVTMCCRIITA